MSERGGMFLPVQAGFAQYMAGFRSGWFVPDTLAGQDWSTRPLAKSMAWVPGRMVDAVTDMLDAWRRNNNTDTSNPTDPVHPGTSAYTPVVLLCLAKDYTPLPGEAGRAHVAKMPVTIPGDTSGRVYHLRQLQGEKRGQIAIIAAETATANSIAAQFLQFWNDRMNQTFYGSYSFAGQVTRWPVMVKAGDAMAVSNPPEQTNLTVLVIDLTLQFSIPQFFNPEGLPVSAELSIVGKGSTDAGTTREASMPLVGMIGVYRNPYGAFTSAEGAILLDDFFIALGEETLVLS